MSANPTLNSDLKTVFHNDLPGWRVKDYLQIHLNMNQDCTFQIWLFGCKWEMELVTMWHLLMVLTKTSRDVGTLYHIIVALSNSTHGTWLRNELLSPPSMTGIICEQTQLDTKYWPKCNKMLTLSAEISCSIWPFVPFDLLFHLVVEIYQNSILAWLGLSLVQPWETTRILEDVSCCSLPWIARAPAFNRMDRWIVLGTFLLALIKVITLIIVLPTSKQVACSLLRCYVHHIFGMGQIMIMKVTWIAPVLPKILWSWFSFASNPRTDLRSPQSSNTVTIKEESADGYIGKIRWLWLPMICAKGQIGWQHWAGAGWGGNMGEVTWSRGNMGKGSPM